MCSIQLSFKSSEANIQSYDPYDGAVKGLLKVLKIKQWRPDGRLNPILVLQANALPIWNLFPTEPIQQKNTQDLCIIDQHIAKEMTVQHDKDWDQWTNEVK